LFDIEKAGLPVFAPDFLSLTLWVTRSTLYDFGVRICKKEQE